MPLTDALCLSVILDFVIGDTGAAVMYLKGWVSQCVICWNRLRHYSWKK